MCGNALIFHNHMLYYELLIEVLTTILSEKPK